MIGLDFLHKRGKSSHRDAETLRFLRVFSEFSVLSVAKDFAVVPIKRRRKKGGHLCYAAPGAGGVAAQEGRGSGVVKGK
jgi:hypothetical protein